MVEIKSYDSIRSRKEIKDNGNLVVFSAYKAAKRAGNELLDIDDFINNKDIQDVIAVFLGHGIREFTACRLRQKRRKNRGHDENQIGLGL